MVIGRSSLVFGGWSYGIGRLFIAAGHEGSGRRDRDVCRRLLLEHGARVRRAARRRVGNGWLAGGTAKRPSYEQVEAGITGHAESVQVVFDPARIIYDQLLDAYWHNIDPTTAAGAVLRLRHAVSADNLFADEAQRIAAEQSKKAIEDSHRFKRVMAQIVRHRRSGRPRRTTSISTRRTRPRISSTASDAAATRG